MWLTDTGQPQGLEYLKWPWTSEFSIPITAGTPGMSVYWHMCVYLLYTISTPPKFYNKSQIWTFKVKKVIFFFSEKTRFKDILASCCLKENRLHVWITSEVALLIYMGGCLPHLPPACSDCICSPCIQQRRRLAPYYVPYCAHRLKASMIVVDLDMA